MPTPIGHALGGLIVSLALAPRRRGAGTVPPRSRRNVEHPNPRNAPEIADRSGAAGGTVPTRDLGICVVAACLPDVDFLWGRHNMETHSLGFAALVGLAVFLVARPRSARLALAAALAVASHVLFDWLGSDDTPPLGVMALWPISSEFYFANAFVFEAISRRYWLPNFVSHNTLAVLRELAILAPVATLLSWWRKQ